MWLKRPVYRGFKGEGKCEGKLSPLTLALTTLSRKRPGWVSGWGEGVTLEFCDFIP
ncbi:hypothetical protein [uncultured Prevotella sp.]|uniref:hypothetical protein n=1 Tax=uncultured Prevotella sp. TaxID=159272 RepID=UPI0026123A69|nr:hypothetical protein [uncultured Prevotella sp.]